ncbi:siderophore-interacting protein [Streptomyces litchfieldiae]|uniref:Siderophore-interacting protein n=1 Tax=Streptomyces litchfieldiae TaxID=3075543 RepID=A0ABU2MWV6_9ACTN|nr:siderophore-interacting protein [Streptomyces sp. DSM 44938]MDT0345554.1 siderophore-interacting protein [Streptomyces sp. DSM 44938]
MTAAPFEFFDLHVLRATRISPGFTRVTLGGERLGQFASGGRDQRCKLFLPRPGQDRAAVPRGMAAEWWPAWQRMDPEERAVLRTYTIREQRREPDELDIDFALHGDTGTACHWAQCARPGDPVTLLGPLDEDNYGVDFRPPPDADWILLTADATALPAVAGILAWLPPGTPAKVWIEVEHAADRQELSTKADADITWLCREELPRGHRTAIVDSLRAAVLPAGAPYAWIAGEAAAVRDQRRHLVNDRCVDRERITFTGYWRRGISEEDLIAEAIAAAA